jgi:hypothetical protein
MASIDTPGSLAADMLKAAAEAVVGTRAIVQKGSLNVKNDAKRNVQQSAPTHNAHAANAITYDTGNDFRGLMSRGEIGYDKDRPGGALGNLLEYGSLHNPPHRDLGRALDAETPRFEEALALFIEKLL